MGCIRIHKCFTLSLIRFYSSVKCIGNGTISSLTMNQLKDNEQKKSDICCFSASPASVFLPSLYFHIIVNWIFLKFGQLIAQNKHLEGVTLVSLKNVSQFQRDILLTKWLNIDKNMSWTVLMCWQPEYLPDQPGWWQRQPLWFPLPCQ